MTVEFLFLVIVGLGSMIAAILAVLEAIRLSDGPEGCGSWSVLLVFALTAALLFFGYTELLDLMGWGPR